MPNGFAGSAANRYLTDVSDAHTNAAGAVESAAISNMPRPRVERLPFPPDGARSMGGQVPTGTGSSENIVVDLMEYETIARNLNNADDRMGECLYRVCQEIENMCQTIYSLPHTVPQCMNITNDIKCTMNEFREITDDVAIAMRKFAREITEIE